MNIAAAAAAIDDNDGPTPAQKRVLEIVVFGLLAYASTHGWMTVIDRILNRIPNPNYLILSYIVYASLTTSVLVALLVVTYDDNPDNDVFRNEREAAHKLRRSAWSELPAEP